jgi:RNA polymerase sigma factor (sigma-70 family)
MFTMNDSISISQEVRLRMPQSVSKSEVHSARTYANDAQLVQDCLDGDERAWSELVERYQRLVYSVPRKYGLSPADAEDVMQAVFLIVYRRLETLRDQTRLSAWLIRIAQRETFHHKSVPEQELTEESLSEVEDSTHAQMERLETQQLVREALARLDDDARTILEAFLRPDPPSYEALAQQLGCPVGSIGPTRARAFKKLQTALHEMGVDVTHN